MSAQQGPPPPPLTPEARAAAAARGVQARQVRAQVRAGLATGSLQVADVLRDGQAMDERGRILARMKVVDLLSSFRGIGPIRAADIMDSIGIAANRRVGGLGPRQVAEITHLVAARNPGGPR
jgi:S13-like H2TH domain